MSATAPAATLTLRAAIYCRISLDDAETEAEHGAGVRRQEEACRELCVREGWSIADIFVDNDISAYSGKQRPEYERMLAAVERGEIDVIVAYHVDRLYRRLTDLSRLIGVVGAVGAEIRTLAAGHVDLSTASGRFTAQVLGAAAEHEAARLGERVAMKHRANAKAGKPAGGARPFGYNRNPNHPGELHINTEEAALIREAADRVLHHGASLNSIVTDWNARGVPTVRGGQHWRPNSVRLVLRSGRNAGLRVRGDEIIAQGTWEPILDRVTWEKLRTRLTHAPAVHRPRRHLLAGMVYCAACGAKMRSISGGNDKYRTRAYACDKTMRNGCGSNSVKADAVEEIVVAYVLSALASTDLSAARALRDDDEATRIAEAISADRSLLDAYAAEQTSLTPSEYLALTAAIRTRLAASQRHLEQLTREVPIDLRSYADLDLDGWDALDLDRQRALAGAFVDRVAIAKGKPGRSFDPTRVSVIERA